MPTLISSFLYTSAVVFHPPTTCPVSIASTQHLLKATWKSVDNQHAKQQQRERSVVYTHYSSRRMRRPGIEPGASRWQRDILPLNQRRWLESTTHPQFFLTTTKKCITYGCIPSRLMSHWILTFQRRYIAAKLEQPRCRL